MFLPVNQENSCSCQKLSDTPLIKGGLRGDQRQNLFSI
ncbi:hypothetical protein MYAER_3891 [Microcystis aeruginosa NIES-2549]|uniref:Uncharacterized protein n=2 Tax=Microcystis aeruginosa TaxID=1126 RepID=A0A0F6U7C2_MICAE|nr:hypothetical protein MYAER_3891 [Microcystis aeruginosa NIES-2549]AOC54630.1 hypothetical protein amyaer_3937 [Microcystis aeruginosa NIES-2481]GAL92441.1 hypothetical protein N44_00999 [Microcystis aeruginosa NIES-44]